MPWTVTVPDSEATRLIPLLAPLPPQLRPAASTAVSAAPNAIRLRRFPHSGPRLPRAIKTSGASQSPAKAQMFSGYTFRRMGKPDAEADAVIVTVAVLLLSRDPTEQVTPASVLEALQEKATLLPARPFMGVKVRVDVAVLPAVIVKVLGETLNEKSPATVVKLNTLDQAPYVPFDEDTALTCQ